MKFNVAIKKFNNELQTLSTNGREFDALDGALTSVSGCWTGRLSFKGESIAFKKDCHSPHIIF